MMSHRSLWLRGGAGVVLLLALAGWVFWASLRDQNKPRSSFGAPERALTPQERQTFHSGDPRTQPGHPGADPHLQEVLRTINEVNRINKMNTELRKTAPDSSVTNGLPPSQTPARTREQNVTTSDTEKP